MSSSRWVNCGQRCSCKRQRRTGRASLATATSSSSLCATGGRRAPCAQLTPAWCLINIDAEYRLGHELTGQKRVGRVNTPQACIAEEPLDQGLFENANTSCQLHRCIDHLPGALDRPVLDGHELGPPHVAVVDAIGPILGDPVKVWADSLEFERHVGDGMLDFSVVSHGA